MALKFSTCLRNKLLGGVITRHPATITGTGIAAVDGGGSADSYTDTGNGFLTAGFAIGDSVIVTGFAGSNAADRGPHTITNVTVNTITMAAGSVVASEAATPSVTITVVAGGSLKDIFKDCVLKIYNGTQPTSPDNALGGATCLATITLASGTFTPGAVANGLEFGVAASGAISKDSGVWSGVVAVSGVATWFRLYANATDAGGADSTYIYPRIDGAIGTSGRELNMTSTSLTSTSTVTVDTFTITLPEA